jgi:hypothetical protein
MALISAALCSNKQTTGDAPTKPAKPLDQVYSGVPEQLLGEKPRRGHDRHEPGVFIHQCLHAAG